MIFIDFSVTDMHCLPSAGPQKSEALREHCRRHRRRRRCRRLARSLGGSPGALCLFAAERCVCVFPFRLQLPCLATSCSPDWLAGWLKVGAATAGATSSQQQLNDGTAAI